jgi:hypothetical protein
MITADIMIYIILLYGNDAFVTYLLREDGPIENLSAFFWIAASVTCFYRIVTSSQKRYLILYFWGIFSFICFGEEISWGQRIFSYSIESIQRINLNNEVNIHNLSFLNHNFGLIKALNNHKFNEINISLIGIFSINRAFYLGYMIYFLIIPLTVRFMKINYLKERFSYFPHNNLFIISNLINIILFFLSGLYFINIAYSEVFEMFIALAVLFYVLFYLCVNPETYYES